MDENTSSLVKKLFKTENENLCKPYNTQKKKHCFWELLRCGPLSFLFTFYLS